MSESDVINSRSVGPPSELFELRVPGRELPIRIGYTAIRDLHANIAASGGGVGLIIGTTTSDADLVDGFELSPWDDGSSSGSRDFQQAIDRSLQSFLQARSIDPSRQLLGWFRSQATGWHEMQEQDRNVARRYFRRLGALFLLIQTPAHRPWSAAVFELNSDGEARSKLPVEFSFDEYLLRNGYSTAVPAGAPYNDLPEPPARWRRIYGIGIGVAAALLVSGLAVYRWYAGANRVEFTSEPPQTSALSLKVVRSDKDFEVSWDHLAPAVQQATSGSLTIREGETSRIIPLDREQLREGRILYTSLLGDLSFRLEVLGGGQIQAESVQVLSWSANLGSGSPANPVAGGKAAGIPSLPAVITPLAPGSSVVADLRAATAKAPNPGASLPAPIKPAQATASKAEPAASAPGPPAPGQAAPSSPVPGIPSSPAPAATTAGPQNPVPGVRPPTPAPDRTPAEAAPVARNTTTPSANAAANPARAAAQTSPNVASAVPPSSAAPPSNAIPPASTAPPSAPIVRPPASPAVIAPPEAKPTAAPANPIASAGAIGNPASNSARVAPIPIKQVNPEMTPRVGLALNAVPGRQIQLSVKVAVDVQGNVTKAEVLASGPDTFANVYVKSAALDAAKLWKFRPSTLNGKPVPGEYTMKFSFP